MPNALDCVHGFFVLLQTLFKATRFPFHICTWNLQPTTTNNTNHTQQPMDAGCLLGCNESNTFVDGWLELGDGFSKLALLVRIELTVAEVLLNPVLAEEDRGGKPLARGDVRLYKSALYNTFFTVLGSDQRDGEVGTGLGHGEGGGSGAGLGSHNLGARVLDPVGQRRHVLVAEVRARDLGVGFGRTVVSENMYRICK